MCLFSRDNDDSFEFPTFIITFVCRYLIYGKSRSWDNNIWEIEFYVIFTHFSMYNACYCENEIIKKKRETFKCLGLSDLSLRRYSGQTDFSIDSEISISCFNVSMTNRYLNRRLLSVSLSYNASILLILEFVASSYNNIFFIFIQSFFAYIRIYTIKMTSHPISLKYNICKLR